MEHIINIILTLTTIVAAGGWFVFYKSNKELKQVEVSKKKIEEKESSLNFYVRNIADLEERLDIAMKKQKDLEKHIIRLERKLNQYEKKYGILDD